jgi:Zn-dependent peptidase ImmA (M78 family)/DNA-binding XRE family transcriptional regulator
MQRESEGHPAKLAANILRARKLAGLTQVKLAGELGISRPTYLAIEGGLRRPTAPELAHIAEITGTTVRDLLSLAASEEPLTVRFRSTPGADSVETAVAALDDYGRRYATYEAWAGEHMQRWEPPVVDIARSGHVDRAAEDLATSERLRLGLGDGPLPNLRALFDEHLGLRVFGLEELRGTKVSGIFAYDPEYGPIIGFNMVNDARRTRWTLCHEYAHFLTERYRSEVTIEDSRRPRTRDRREIFADRFAAAFLMPGSGISRRFSELIRESDGRVTVSHLVLLAHYFEVSFHALVKRLEELGRVSPGTYEDLISRGFKPMAAERELGIDRSGEYLNRLPLRYVTLIARLYGRGKLSEGDVSKALRVDRLSARELLEGVDGADPEGLISLDISVEGVA